MTEIDPSLINWPADQPPYGNFPAAVQGETARWNAIGLASGMVRDGERQIAVSGFANAITGYPLVPDSMFIIASITKTYVATLVMRLSEQGIFDLDTPVVTYLPDFKLSQDDVRDAITLRKLLSHTSGFDGDRFTDYGRGDDAYDKAVAEFHTLTQWFQPGTFYSYNNAGFYLIGHIIQRLTGKSFEKVMTEEIFAPLGLQHTTLMPEDVLNRPYAAGHVVDRVAGISLAPNIHLPRHTNAAGGIMQSVGDLLTFAQMHLNLGAIHGKQIISRENAQLMQEPIIPTEEPTVSYGLGWSITSRPGHMRMGHGGTWVGHRTKLTIVPKENFAIATLGNSSAATDACRSLEQWALSHELHVIDPKPEVVDLTQLELSAYTGHYKRHDSEYDVAVTDQGLQITAQAFNEDTGEKDGPATIVEMEPIGDGKFRVTSPVLRGEIIDFNPVPDGAGNVRDLIRVHGRLAIREGNEAD